MVKESNYFLLSIDSNLHRLAIGKHKAMKFLQGIIYKRFIDIMRDTYSLKISYVCPIGK